MVQSTPESALQIKRWEGQQTPLSKVLRIPAGYTTNRRLVVADTLPSLPHLCIYNAVGPCCEDYSKHSVPYRYSPALRYPAFLLQSSSCPFPSRLLAMRQMACALPQKYRKKHAI